MREEADLLVKAFKTVATSVRLYYDITHSQGSGACWTGELSLKTFIENLPKLKKEYPYLYRYFTEDYEETVIEAKKLIVKLKLQNLPFPWVQVERKNSLYCHEEAMSYSTYVEDTQYSVWGYFYNNNSDAEFKELEVLILQYLKEVEPVLINMCETLALIAHKHLTKVSDSLREKHL